ncbi:MAG: hypothetical protein ACOX4V_09145 [Anaerovoracaceae bacterium]|jgi:hypothetical protein|nr:hypothetical protein [Clostridiales bacterium]
MLIGIKYCGGCNPRYNRGGAFETIKKQLPNNVEFAIAEESIEYDYLLVIGGCTKCCASYCQYQVKNDIIFVRNEDHIDMAITKIEDIVGGK